MLDAAVSQDVRTAPVPIASAQELLPYAVLAGFVLFVLMYFVGSEQGAASLVSGASIHELLHDGRHLLGFPCH